MDVFFVKMFEMFLGMVINICDVDFRARNF